MKFSDILSEINGDISFEEACKKYRFIKKEECDGVCICKKSISRMYIYQHEDPDKDILILGSGCRKTLKDKGYFGNKFPSNIIKTKVIKSGENTKNYNDLVEHYNSYKLRKCENCDNEYTRYNYDYCGKCEYKKKCKSCKKNFNPKYNFSKECKDCYNNKERRECVACEDLFKIKFKNQLICGYCYKKHKNDDECLICEKKIDSKYFLCYKCNKKYI